MKSISRVIIKSRSFRRLILLATFIASIFYLTWRIFFTLPFTHGPMSVFWGVVLVLCEVMTVVEMFSHFHNSMVLKIPEMPDITDDMYGHVDVLVVTHNEETELLHKTLNGCKYMKYPDKSRVHIYLCDDGNREEMRQLAERMGVGYFAVKNNRTAKAGNLNHALARTDSPFVVVFDSDMIPTSDFLIETVPYFYIPQMIKDNGVWRMRTPEEKDPKEKPIGYVQTRQSFYNPDMLQRNLRMELSAPNELDYFYREVNVSRMANESAAFAGSNVMFARQALEDAGGIIFSITEDLATSIAILGKGYRSLSLDKELAHGLAPEDAWAFIKQRQRWSRGAAHDIISMRFWKSGLSARSKFGFFIAYLYWWTFVRRFVYIACPILWGLFGIVVADISLFALLLVWLPYYVLYNITLEVMSDGTQSALWSGGVDTVQFPYLMWCIIAGTIKIPQNTFHVTPKTRVTGKNSSLDLAIPHIVLAAASLVGIFVCSYHLVVYRYEGALIVLFWLLYNLFALANAIVYYYGRSNNRYYERIPTPVRVTIHYGREISGYTSDLSEGGLAVLLDTPEYLPYDENFEVEVTDREYRAVLQATVRQVVQVGNKWKYSLSLQSIEDEDLGEYLQILYDRDHLLPRVVNMTVLNDIKTIVKSMSAKPRRGERRLPRFELAVRAHSPEAGPVSVINFNYKFILIKGEGALPEKLTLHLDDNLGFVCVRDGEPDGEADDQPQLFRIENWESLPRDPHFRTFLDRYFLTGEGGRLPGDGGQAMAG